MNQFRSDKPPNKKEKTRLDYFLKFELKGHLQSASYGYADQFINRILYLILLLFFHLSFLILKN